MAGHIRIRGDDPFGIFHKSQRERERERERDDLQIGWREFVFMSVVLK